MSEYRQSQWSCQTCSQGFPTHEDLRTHIQAYKVRARNLLAELQKVLLHAQHQPSSPHSGSSDTSEDENDGSLILPTGTTPEGSFINGANLRCPHVECSGELRKRYTTKSNLNRHYTTHVEINEECAFCRSSFTRLRYFVTHLDTCKVKNPEKDGRKQSEALKERKDRLCRKATQQLNQQLSIIVNTKPGQSSIAGHTRSHGNGPTKGVSRKGRAGPLVIRSHNSGKGDDASSVSESSADERSIHAEERPPIQKRRRTGTIVSSEPFSSAQSNQSHQAHEEGNIGPETMALYNSNTKSSLDSTYVPQVPLAGADSTAGTPQPKSMEKSVSKKRPLEGQNQASGLLTGLVYELTYGDLQVLANSNQIHGRILLTDPYEQTCSPFITIQILEDLRNQFATQRVRIM